MKRICDPSLLPVLWALPHIDFDDSTALAVIGNVFGEPTLIDFVGGNIAPVSRTMDCTTEPSHFKAHVKNAAYMELISLAVETTGISSPLIRNVKDAEHVLQSAQLV